MFKQLFGNFLLSKKIITSEQLQEALDFEKSVHLKLGIIAVNAGFMSADNVNLVHNTQSKVDKKFGEIAIEMGFLNEEKLQTLLSTQKSGQLLLGQALLDKKYMTLEQLEEALNLYKSDFALTNKQFELLQNGDVEEVVNTFYSFNDFPESKLYKNYFSLLLRNIIRFISDDFRPLEIMPIQSYESDCSALQGITGEVNLYTCIGAAKKEFISFAGVYANESFTVNDEYTQSCVEEFLNQVNGLFIVNLSNTGIELELTPPSAHSGKSSIELPSAFCLPILFSFGRIDFIISKSK